MQAVRSTHSVRTLIASAIVCLAAVQPLHVTAQSVTPRIIRFNGGAFDRAGAIARDAAGNTYVAGSVESRNRAVTFAVVKHGPQGNVVWVAHYSGASGGVGGQALAVAVDAAGNVYAAGFSAMARDTFNTNIDFLTVKFDASGVEQWSRRFDGPLASFDQATRIALDAAGNAYVSGISYGNGFDWLTFKYSPAGAVLWERRLSGEGPSDDRVADMALDADGNVALTGWTQNRGDGQTNDITTVRYDPQGTLLLRADFTETGISHEFAFDLDADSDGNLTVTGTTAADASPYTAPAPITLKYNRGGSLVAAVRDDAAGGSAVDTDAAGNLYVAGTAAGGAFEPGAATVARFDALGNRVWVTSLGPSVSVSRVAVDAAGNVYVAGTGSGASGTNSDYAVFKVDANGALLWQFHFNGTGNRADVVADISLDGSGRLFVTGTSWGNYVSIGGTADDIVTLEFANGGAPAQSLAAPSDLRATAIGSGLVTLAWRDNSAGESGFRVERCQGSGCSDFAPLGQTGPNATTFSDTSVVRGTTYRYRVRAFDAGGESPSSNAASAKTPRR